MKYQVTLLDKTNTYKPVSAIVESVTKISTTEEKKAIQKKGITKICNSRRWSSKDLQNYGYTVVKMREYDAEKITRENKERYEKLKEEKYASGEWKRPKSKIDLTV